MGNNKDSNFAVMKYFIKFLFCRFTVKAKTCWSTDTFSFCLLPSGCDKKHYCIDEVKMHEL